MTDQNFWKTRMKEGAVLSPVDRISEVLFGVIMVLTFTGAISVATDGRQEIKELLWAALGCNLAWGIVDAIMYLMNVLLERGHATQALKKISVASNRIESRKILREEIQPAVAALMTDEELDNLTERIKKQPAPSIRDLITIHDLLAGVQIFFLVFLCTLPVALPFAFINEISVAMRTANGVALLQLFIGGYLLARYAGFRRIVTALVYTIVGLILVALTIALGG